ncbi:type II secretion system minor pseudopilin GspH [Legionella sp. PC997]|uniref:type II secretion system minor pseudopilin GspH n=1 Tax=Legionella sp. PC997 TaxID=2755562 RepID=UPI0015FD3933|nr:type II secretion system minor pseudopilin GspH [Legionella sp. PC997]
MNQSNKYFWDTAIESEVGKDTVHGTARYTHVQGVSSKYFPSAVSRKLNHGFTLIEILIVLVIIGITFGFALIAFGDFGESRRLLFSAEQLVNTLRLAQQKAILETSTLGLRIDNTGYQILQLHNNAQWKPISDKGVFKMTYFPNDTHITLKTLNSTPVGTPSIIIFASGDLTPFTLNFGSKKDNNLAMLIGKRNGDLTLNVVHTK